VSNRELWAKAAELVGEQELARRFRVWVNNLIKKELARRSNLTLSEFYLVQDGEVLADLNELTGRRYTLTDETKALIRGRMSGGAGVDDFKRVHKAMCARWLADAKMRDYLRPSTLYRAGNFDEYLALSFEAKKTDKKDEQMNRSTEEQRDREEQMELTRKLMTRAWWEFESWDAFMRWTLQFPTAESLGRYEMPERIRRMRTAPGMVMKLLAGRVDWAETEYEQIKANRGDNG
jgi:uncharacterized phage protein (TIGR02220 family)